MGRPFRSLPPALLLTLVSATESHPPCQKALSCLEDVLCLQLQARDPPSACAGSALLTPRQVSVCWAGFSTLRPGPM